VVEVEGLKAFENLHLARRRGQALIKQSCADASPQVHCCSL
jgi:hypothetical protein